jgi:hypothetical protein
MVWRRGGEAVGVGGEGDHRLQSHFLVEPTPSALGPRTLMSARKSMQRAPVQVNVEDFEGGIPVRAAVSTAACVCVSPRVVLRVACTHRGAPSRRL